MLGPYTANDDGTISYKGNRIFFPIKNIGLSEVPLSEISNRVKDFSENEMWKHLAQINHRINISTNEYFDKLGALFTILPLTTRMISSPGAIYGKYKINYTTDTCPITLKWFDLPKNVFLSESSQIYLELALIQKNVNQVYSIYNSFRKEAADATHLSEFHHIEYEGKINQEQNEEIILNLLKKIILDILNKKTKDISFFLHREKIKELENFAKNIHKVPKVTFKEVLELLYENTKNRKYKEFSLKHFNSWEEVKITEIFGSMVIIKKFPLLEVPFYHTIVDGEEPQVANNADFIWPCYREIIGSGHRVRSIKELEQKSKIFNLPMKDYQPYLDSRKQKNYTSTSGFGMGWERFLQGLLEMPFIWNVCNFPRIDKNMVP